MVYIIQMKVHNSHIILGLDERNLRASIHRDPVYMPGGILIL